MIPSFILGAAGLPFVIFVVKLGCLSMMKQNSHNKKEYEKYISDCCKYYSKLIEKYIRNSSNGDMLLALLREKNEMLVRITKNYYGSK